jgi:hypothetical protein
VFDAEAAWADLAEVIASRPGWGPDALLAQMRKLETKHRVTEGLFGRFVRLFGDRFEVSVNRAEPVTAGELEAMPLAAESGAAPPTVQGGHDGSRSRRRSPAAA